jgi:hypothetical protein
MRQRLILFLRWMNERGIPVPLARIENKPSVSFSLLIISAAFVMASLLNEFLKLDIGFWEALSWHVTSAILYYNRSAKVSKDGIEIGSSEEPKKEEKPTLEDPEPRD